MASFLPQPLTSATTTVSEPTTPPAGSIFWALPLPVQQHVIAFLPPPDQSTLRSTCTYARALVSDLVRTLTLCLNPLAPLENRAQALSIRYEPLQRRFPCARALHITAVRCWRPPPSALHADGHASDPQGDLIELLQACASFIHTCTSFTLTCYDGPHTLHLHPEPRLLSALQSVLAPAAATLTHLHIAFPPYRPYMPHLHELLHNIPAPIAPPSRTPLPLLLPATPLPALSHLHVCAMLDASPANPALAALPLPPAPRLRTLTLTKLPLHAPPSAAAHLPAAYPALTALTLEFHRDPGSNARPPDLLPLTTLTALATLRVDGAHASLRAAVTAPLAALRSLSSLVLLNWRVLRPDGIAALAHASQRLRSLALEQVVCDSNRVLGQLSCLTQLTSLEIALGGAWPGVDVPATAGVDLGLSQLRPLAATLHRLVVRGSGARPGLEVELAGLPADLAALLQMDDDHELLFGEDSLIEGLLLDDSAAVVF